MSTTCPIALWIVAFFILCTSVTSHTGCPRGSFWDAAASKCTLCPPGSYQHATNATSCIPCEPGKYVPYHGAQSSLVCRHCPAGTYTLAGWSACRPCPKGTSSAERSARCSSCPKGTFISGAPWLWDALSTCEACYGGYSDEENLLECKRCPLGHASAPGSTTIDQCYPCPPGTASEGFNQCSECQPGTFSDQAMSAECKPCPVGSIAEKTFGSKTCIPCQPGQYGKVDSGYGAVSPACFACPDGTNSYSPGRRFCRRNNGPCPRGYIQTSSGDCERCQTDERYDLELQKCVLCPANEGTVGGLPLKCTPCSKLLRAQVETPHCVPQELRYRSTVIKHTCPPGTHIHDREFVRFCVPCDSGFFSSKPNSAECIPCRDGTISKEPGTRRCEPCPPGMISDESRQSCVDRLTGCPTDTQLFVDDYGNAQCVSKDCTFSQDGSYSCPPCTGSYFSSFTFEGCEPCPGNQVRDTSFKCGCRGELAQNLGIVKGTCSECPAGSYGKPATEGDEHKCVKCPAGTYRVVASYERLLGSLCPGCTPNQPCQKCAAGFVAPHDGATECEQCPPGTFSYGVGDTECLTFGDATEET